MRQDWADLGRHVIRLAQERLSAAVQRHEAARRAQAALLAANRHDLRVVLDRWTGPLADEFKPRAVAAAPPEPHLADQPGDRLGRAGIIDLAAGRARLTSDDPGGEAA